MNHKTSSEQQMIELGKKIAADLKGGDIVLLYGDLGAGKTTLTKGIASYFGIEDVVSPTFTLMQTYQITDNRHRITKLAHIDTYRLENEEDLIEIGVEDYLGDENTVCIIEWPEKIEGLLKNKKVLNIKIEHVDKNERRIKIKK